MAKLSSVCAKKLDFTDLDSLRIMYSFSLISLFSVFLIILSLLGVIVNISPISKIAT